MKRLVVLLIALIWPTHALAGDLTVALKTASGTPVTDAVVSFKPAAGVSAPLHAAGPYRIKQVDVHFDPFILVVPAGAEVSFPNQDKVRHHVYSFSATKRFEIKLYGRDESRSIVFDHPGVVSLGCNIHDRMMGFVVVTDTPYVAKVDRSGQVLLENIPAGGGVLTVWQPFLKAQGNTVTQQMVIPAQGAAHAALTLNLREQPSDKAPLLD